MIRRTLPVMLRSLTTVVSLPFICVWEFFRVLTIMSFAFCCNAFVLYNTRTSRSKMMNSVMEILQTEHEDTEAGFFPSGNLRWLTSLLSPQRAKRYPLPLLHRFLQKGGLEYPLCFWYYACIIAASNARRAYILVDADNVPPEWTFVAAVELPALLHFNKGISSIKIFNLSEPQAPYVGKIHRDTLTSPWKINFTGDEDEGKKIQTKTRIKFKALFQESLKRRQPMPYSEFLALRLKKFCNPATTTVQSFMGDAFARLFLSRWVD
mmetsp:Transcript_24386/g.41007  ORF Transcript_24386/g.41007 Transcript_24386/m.41007 type:complete len:265 (-) Transcript_24386:128-922(-)